MEANVCALLTGGQALLSISELCQFSDSMCPVSLCGLLRDPEKRVART